MSEQNFITAPPLSATAETGKLRLTLRAEYRYFSVNMCVSFYPNDSRNCYSIDGMADHQTSYKHQIIHYLSFFTSGEVSKERI